MFLFFDLGVEERTRERGRGERSQNVTFSHRNEEEGGKEKKVGAEIMEWALEKQTPPEPPIARNVFFFLAPKFHRCIFFDNALFPALGIALGIFSANVVVTAFPYGRRRKERKENRYFRNIVKG